MMKDDNVVGKTDDDDHDDNDDVNVNNENKDAVDVCS